MARRRYCGEESRDLGGERQSTAMEMAQRCHDEGSRGGYELRASTGHMGLGGLVALAQQHASVWWRRLLRTIALSAARIPSI
jgi:hypothetical protein